MSTNNDIEIYGRRVREALPNEAQRDFRRFVEALENLAVEVEHLQTRVAHLESRLA